MKISEIVKGLSLEVKSANENLEKEVTGGYVSDLLSDVIANCKEGNIWITLQTHQNIIAVAVLRELSGIILVNGKSPDADTIKKANEEGIPLMASSLPAFEIVGRLYNIGIRCQ